jgi:predicted nucleotidyltransferase
MTSTGLPPVLAQLAAACRADERLLALFITGSHALGTADKHSDIDVGLIATDEAYDEFFAARADFLRQLGEPLFLEDFDSPVTLFFILSDGTEGELAVARRSAFSEMVKGPYRVIVDKIGILANATFSGRQLGPEEQREQARRLVVWFWHDFGHFVTAIGRGQLLWAYGQLETLRRCCLGIARVAHDATDADAAEDPYFKVDEVLPAQQLAVFAQSTGAIDAGSMVASARHLASIYGQLAPAVARRHGLEYPHALERLMLERLADASGPLMDSTSESARGAR